MKVYQNTAIFVSLRNIDHETQDSMLYVVQQLKPTTLDLKFVRYELTWTYKYVFENGEGEEQSLNISNIKQITYHFLSPRLVKNLSLT